MKYEIMDWETDKGFFYINGTLKVTKRGVKVNLKDVGIVLEVADLRQLLVLLRLKLTVVDSADNQKFRYMITRDGVECTVSGVLDRTISLDAFCSNY